MPLQSPKLPLRRFSTGLVFGFGVIAVLLIPDQTARAHRAISGWVYPLDCCNEKDCRQLSEAEVTIGPDYYIWKGKHISFTSPKIRNSPDGFYHGCENAHWGDTSGNLEISCFFVPANG